MDANQISHMVLLLLVVLAVILDFQSFRISNRLIVTGWILALVLCIVQGRVSDIGHVLWNISFPVILLYLFYLVGVIGAGDVKLFSLIGGYLSFHNLVSCIVFSFLIGAVLSFGKMCVTKQLFSGLKRAGCYFGGLITTGKIITYERNINQNQNLIHFSFAILLGLILTGICSYTGWRL